MIRPLNACCFPKTPQDQLTFLVFLFGGPFLVWYEFLHVRPRTANNPDFLWMHIVAVGFIFFNVYSNLFKMIRTDVTIKRQKIADVVETDSDERTCDKCGHRKPDRTHHCKICDSCVLKRDHHCWFAGYCVGYHNQRYYFMTILYCWIAGIYAQIYYVEFVVLVLGSSLWTVVGLLGPHVALILGYYTTYEFGIAALTSVGLVLEAMLTWLLQIQTMQILNGQTKHERSKGIDVYNRGVYENVKEVFGDRWFLVWLSAFIPSELPGDGVHFIGGKKQK